MARGIMYMGVSVGMKEIDKEREGGREGKSEYTLK